MPAAPRWIGFQHPIRDVVFGADGSIYVSEWELGTNNGTIHHFSADGEVLPGWAVSVEGSPTLVMDEDWLMASVCPAVPNEAPCELHRYRPDGTQEAGWPISTAKDCYSAELAWQGALVLVCADGDATILVAADRTGRLTDGWPVTVRGFRMIGSAPGGLLHVSSVPEPGQVRLDVLTRKGQSSEGWPVVLDQASDRYGSFGMIQNPGGFLLAWWMEDVTPDSICLDARRTMLSAMEADGTTGAGWPVALDGFGSRPVADTQRRVWVRTDGARSALFGLDAGGQPLDGWPIDLPPDRCAGADGSAAVHLIPDGRLVVVQDGILYGYEVDGSASPGWPKLLDGLVPDGCYPDLCTPGSNQAVPPVVDSNGRMYIALVRGEGANQSVQLMAWDRDGDSPHGWPLEIPTLACYPASCPFPVPRITDIRITTGGAVVVVASEGLFLVGLGTS